MASTTVVLAPLAAVRDAVYARIESDAATSGYTLASEAGQAAFPYLAVGPAYKGAGGTDAGLVTHVVVQVDAYAATEAGGSNAVSAMLDAVAVALSRSALTATVQTEDGPETSAPFAIVVEDDVLTPDLLDPETREGYARRYVRFRFVVTTT